MQVTECVLTVYIPNYCCSQLLQNSTYCISSVLQTTTVQTPMHEKAYPYIYKYILILSLCIMRASWHSWKGLVFVCKQHEQTTVLVPPLIGHQTIQPQKWVTPNMTSQWYIIQYMLSRCTICCPGCTSLKSSTLVQTPTKTFSRWKLF